MSLLPRLALLASPPFSPQSSIIAKDAMTTLTAAASRPEEPVAAIAGAAAPDGCVVGTLAPPFGCTNTALCEMRRTVCCCVRVLVDCPGWTATTTCTRVLVRVTSCCETTDEPLCSDVVLGGCTVDVTMPPPCPCPLSLPLAVTVTVRVGCC